jgi:predicted O-methyltransferase YrrM
MRKFLNRLAAFLMVSLNQRLLDLREAFDNQSAAINRRLDRLAQEGLPTPAAKLELAGPLFEPRMGSDPVADISLVERYSHDWAANAPSYRQTFGDLRCAAQRLLPMQQGSFRDARALPDQAMKTLRHLEDHVSCLARQPLFFVEMFHGVRLLPDGKFEPLAASEFEHIRATGLLGREDRVVIEEIYWRLFQRRTGPLRIVEIGSAAGRGSTRIGGEYVKRTGGTLYCIDPHETDPAHLVFLANLRIFELESTVLPIRANSIDAAALFDDGSLDAVFVDGSHIYPNVLADIDAYLPKIRPGGILFGHDLHDLPSRFDRDELLRVSDKNNTEVSYRGGRADVHPGVILAVQDRFGDGIETFTGSVVWARQV